MAPPLLPNWQTVSDMCQTSPASSKQLTPLPHDIIHSSTMRTFSKDHIIILPHSEEYRRLYDISPDEVLLTLNNPEIHEGISSDRYTVEKTNGNHRIYLYYYLTLPLQAKQDELYAVIDFIGFTPIKTQ